MPAKIVVKSGSAAKQVFPIEEELMRIGSDPTCDLVLPDANLAPHAATLEFLDGNYIVYNRSDVILRLNNAPIPVRGSKPWKPGQELQLNDQVVLRLEVDLVNPAPPVAPPSSQHLPALTPDQMKNLPPALDEVAKGDRRQKQYLTLGLLAAAFLALYFIEPTTSPSAAKTEMKPELAFEAIIKEWSDEKKLPRELSDTLRSTRFMLQEARIAELRGDTETAKHLYAQVIEILLPRRDRDDRHPLEEHMWNFVKNRMDKL